MLVPKIGKTYKLRNLPEMGDYAGSIVEVEAGPRNVGITKQYRVSWGNGAYDVDWIETSMFEGAVTYDQSIKSD